MVHLGVLGFGKMGEAIVHGLLKSWHDEKLSISGTTRSAETAKEVMTKLSSVSPSTQVSCHTNNEKLVEESDIILLCLKPQNTQEVLKKLSLKIKKKHLLISICASLTTDHIFEWSGKRAAVIRAMPNTPCLINQGMTVLCPGPRMAEAQMQLAQKIFATLGETLVVEENLMDGVTGLSGCGPAYVYLIIEALSEAGVKLGLSRSDATLMAAQTLAGSAQMVLKRGIHPAALKDEVTTPAGCTIDGLMALEDGKLRVTLIKAVVAAAERSRTLRKN